MGIAVFISGEKSDVFLCLAFINFVIYLIARLSGGTEVRRGCQIVSGNLHAPPGDQNGHIQRQKVQHESKRLHSVRRSGYILLRQCH